MIYNVDALSYIKETPKVLTSILGNIEQITKCSMDLICESKNDEWYLVGCGSSFHSAKLAANYIQNLLGIRVFTLSPGELFDMEPLMSNHAIVIGISQQGTSVGVISAMDLVRKKKIRTIAVTGEYDTEITFHADATLYVECGIEDAGATTKGFTATAFTLMMLGEKLWERENHITFEQKSAFETNLKGIIEEMQEELALQSEKCEEISDQLKESNDLMIIAGDRWKSMLKEIVLKFSETCRFSVRGFETEEFMHGLYNAVNENTDFLFLWDDNTKGIRKLYDYYKAKGNRVFSMGNTRSANNTAALSGKGCFSVFRDLLPIQKLFVMTSKKRGINLNIPRDPDFHKKMGSKLEEENEIKKKEN